MTTCEPPDDTPAITVTPRRVVGGRRPVDALARATYLDTLARTGSRSAAAAAARPHLRSRSSAMATFEAHMRANPGFAAQVADVEAHFAGRVDAEIAKRALEGTRVYVRRDAETGEVVEERIDYDNKLLLTLARNVSRRANPDAWAPEDRRLVVEGEVRSVNVNVDLERVLSGMSTEAIRDLVEAARRAKELGPGGDDGGEVIDVGEEDGGDDPVLAAMERVEGAEAGN